MFLIFWLNILLLGCSLAQHAAYSLQTAVDALNRRDMMLYPGRERYNAFQEAPDGWGNVAAPMGDFENPNLEYWEEDNPSANYNRHRLNKILAKFLTDNNAMGGEQQQLQQFAGRYDFNDDNNVRSYLAASLPDEKKRSTYFRERETKYDSPMQSAFREREPYNHAELTDQFLKEIEESKELDREERYKEALRRLWEKYQQQENEIEGDLFEGQKRFASTSPSASNNYYIGPLMQKKRTYPVLPWLPVSSRRKRFPVSKRSPSPAQTETHFAETNEKVAQDLSELFGSAKVEEKQKRSPNESQHSQMIGAVGEANEEKKPKNIRMEDAANVTTAKNSSGSHQAAHHHKHNHRKRNDHAGDDDNDDNDDVDDDESEERDDHEENENDDDDDEHEFGEDEEEEEAKKKRAIPANFRRKKSIQWSKYFGIDRRKKSSVATPDEAKSNSDVKKRSTSTETSAPAAGSDNNDVSELDKRKKKDLDPRKLESMDRKLQSIEDLIIDETIKYTGAHEGIVDPEEIRRLKDHVVSRLATAYSLEKMRRSLEKLRQSIDKDNHILYNVIEGDDEAGGGHWSEISEALKKRLSVKKEKVQFHPAANGLPGIEKSKELPSNSIEGAASSDDNETSPNVEEKKTKKRTGYLRYPTVPNTIADFEDAIGTGGQFEPLNDAYLGNKNYIFGSNQCPLIESMAERCRGVDLLSGDVHQKLLPICGVHQICYLCGVSQVGCDFQYLAEADTICGRNSECQSAARSVLMILRGSPGPQLGPKECLKNPCLYGAMREIGL